MQRHWKYPQDGMGVDCKYLRGLKVGMRLVYI